MTEVLLASILAFVSTNIDDLFLLTLFFGNKRFKDIEIITGQYLGIVLLIAISLTGSLADIFVSQKYIGLLGLIPIYLGIRGMVDLVTVQRKDDVATDTGASAAWHNNVLTVAGVTFANGGDNIGIYVPLFSTLNAGNKIIMVIVFLALTFLWCMVAKYFTKHPYAEKLVSRYGHIMTPFVLLLLGAYIIYESGTVGLIK